ncbi:hypothetical protein J32TS6_28990 [Virgibacillus pantothenticus]|uniref:Uncharacterized protein n=1 Tax=Virgibacillus pantothenticus TaxID=1473 RepID=A0A0L0QU79_VIRPA|nr:MULTISPECIES: hypothetical protein [Virgibacillus]API90984.1 hypothetical protein BKP57_03405 [Virgibacillus sp. 6R]KNE22057.1 hypothetical protein AFK71_04460 [Virgibacillus pantothenticus]MBS7428966.1 hypothetical protein [Virgibacillus sp. 19R1-5]MBU8566719.1 hypothetical protein [Virgibacillus pantothenticus]MBU8600302.1 hypothetical protein [Virgibacillus pantothenticus]
MDQALKQLAADFIAMPLAKAAFRHDQQYFDGLHDPDFYLDFTDEAIRLIQMDLSATKEQLYTKYHLDIKRIGKTTYKWKHKNKSGVWSYTPEQLKDMTVRVCKRYLFKAVGFEQKRASYMKFVPPDV